MWKRGEIYGEEGARQENSRHSLSCMSGRRDAAQCMLRMMRSRIQFS
jgi:hypothetical protein